MGCYYVFIARHILNIPRLGVQSLSGLLGYWFECRWSFIPCYIHTEMLNNREFRSKNISLCTNFQQRWYQIIIALLFWTWPHICGMTGSRKGKRRCGGIHGWLVIHTMQDWVNALTSLSEPSCFGGGDERYDTPDMMQDTHEFHQFNIFYVAGNVHWGLRRLITEGSHNTTDRSWIGARRCRILNCASWTSMSDPIPVTFILSSISLHGPLAVFFLQNGYDIWLSSVDSLIVSMPFCKHLKWTPSDARSTILIVYLLETGKIHL